MAMYPYSAMIQIPKFNLKYCKPMGRGKGQWVCDAVITFDTETTTFFLVDGEWKSEKYTTQEERKNAMDTLGIVYAWACRMPGLTVYGRTKKEMYEFFSRLENVNPMFKLTWIHNLNYDYSFISDMFPPDPLAKKAIISRAKMAPIKIKVDGFNMEFRDSYALNNMSLAKIGDAYNCGKKLKGDLDYTEAHLPNTPLSTEELEYLERDVDILYEYMLTQWIEPYNHEWLQLPYTQTGVPRREVKRMLSEGDEGKKYMKQMKSIMPRTVEEYQNLHEPFAGGVAHANYLYASDDNDKPEVVPDVTSADRASSYPTEAATRKFPNSKFIKMSDPTQMDIYEEDHVYIVLVKYTNIIQRTPWDYISYSKCHEPPKNAVVDNGRIASADEVVIKITNIDMRIINNVYTYDECEIIEAYVASADYLPFKFVDYLLTLYGNKTSLKKADPALYMRSKQILNSLYGMICTDICKEEVYFKDGVWSSEYEDKDEGEIAYAMSQKLEANKPFLPYSVGVFITAYAREQLFEPILHYDPDADTIEGIAGDAVYTDTDSVKFVNADDNVVYIERYNERMLERLHKVAKERGIPYERFAPLDPDGHPHPLGVFEADGHYDEFVTMGSKKYCYHVKQEDGTMKFGFTVAGLQKSYVDATGEHKTMTSMDQMTPGTHVSHGRTNYTYSTCQQLVILTDYMGNQYRNDYERGVSMWRTDYTFSLSGDYEELLSDNLLDLWKQKTFNKLSSPLAQIAEWRKEEICE